MKLDPEVFRAAARRLEAGLNHLSCIALCDARGVAYNELDPYVQAWGARHRDAHWWWPSASSKAGRQARIDALLAFAAELEGTNQ